MINSVSGQNYSNPYAMLQSGQPAGDMTMARMPSGGSQVVIGTPDIKKNQEIGPKECETCRARKYKDRSNDVSVSFQTPTHVAPEMAASAVAAHEREHVQHNAQKADSEEMKARSIVQIHTAVCPECGRIYVSGGTTTTYYSKKQETSGEADNGLFVDIKA